jgi:hypothetical protein
MKQLFYFIAIVILMVIAHRVMAKVKDVEDVEDLKDLKEDEDDDNNELA